MTAASSCSPASGQARDTKFRNPSPTNAATCATGSGSSPNSCLVRLTAVAKSARESIRVPSKSKISATLITNSFLSQKWKRHTISFFYYNGVLNRSKKNTNWVNIFFLSTIVPVMFYFENAQCNGYYLKWQYWIQG